MTLPERTLISMEASRIAGNKLPQYLATYLATLSAVSAGAVLVWTSPALQVLDVPFTMEQGSWIASLVTVGAFAGALPAGWLTNLVGRKRLLVAAAGVLLVSWLVIANASTVFALYVGRLLAGTTVGIISVAAPMYIAEVAESDVRGTLGTFFQLQITVGALLMYLFGGCTRNATLISLAAAVVPVAFFYSFVWVQESQI